MSRTTKRAKLKAVKIKQPKDQGHYTSDVSISKQRAKLQNVKS